MIVNPKVKWGGLLLLASSLFLIGMLTQNIAFFLATIILTFYIRQNGYDSLFKEFDDERKAKRLKMEVLMEKVKDKRLAEKTLKTIGEVENE